MRRRRPGRGDDRPAGRLGLFTRARQAVGQTLRAAELQVRLQPRARRDEVVGERDGRIVLRVTAPAIDGRANRALCRLVAKRLGVAKSRVSIVRGESSRDKLVRVEGVGAEEAQRALLAG